MNTEVVCTLNNLALNNLQDKFENFEFEVKFSKLPHVGKCFCLKIENKTTSKVKEFPIGIDAKQAESVLNNDGLIKNLKYYVKNRGI